MPQLLLIASHTLLQVPLLPFRPARAFHKTPISCYFRCCTSLEPPTRSNQMAPTLVYPLSLVALQSVAKGIACVSSHPSVSPSFSHSRPSLRPRSRRQDPICSVLDQNVPTWITTLHVTGVSL